MVSKRKLMEFAEFVAQEVMDNNFEDNAGAFAELACRRLWRLGIIERDGDYWQRTIQDDE